MIWRKHIYSGTCVCGHSWEDHHLGAVMNQECYAATGEAWLPQECEFYGFNETGGLGPEGQYHCHQYIDKDDPETDRLVREEKKYYTNDSFRYPPSEF